MSHQNLPRERRPVIVVGVDGSDAGNAALRWAIESATAQGGTVRAVSVRHGDEVVPAPAPVERFGLHVGERDGKTSLARLHEFVEQARSGIDHPAEVTEISTVGDPETALAGSAVDADLLVVGGHGRGPLSEVFLGDVAAAAIRHAPCPVVVVPHPAPDRFPVHL